jgi:allantoinase
MRRRYESMAAALLAAMAFFITLPSSAQSGSDWITGLPREPIHVKAWPGDKKVAVCFIFDVEVWGHGQGPNFRPDTATRSPDVVDESFREYAINFGVPRVASVFKDEGVPLSIALNALFPGERPEVWKQLRALAPDAPIVAHGMNNSTQLLPLGQGIRAQEAYIAHTLDLLEKDTGKRPTGWQSPSVYPNADTFSAITAKGITYTLDGMDSDTLSELKTKSGPLVMIPYPVTTVDMGQYLQRAKEPGDMEKIWTEYITELAREAEADPSREAVVLVIGIHPFVFGTPNGAATMRRVLENLKSQKLVWLTDVESVLGAAGIKR